MTKGNELKQRATKAIIAHAFFRLESALTIAMTIILSALFPKPFPWWEWWYWLVLGIVGETLIVYTSITDEMTMRKVVADMLRQQFNPREIRTHEYRQRVEKALEYRQRIEEHVRSTTSRVLRDHLLETTAGIADWVANVFSLAKRLDRYNNDQILLQDRRDLPREIAALQARLQREDDEAVRQELRQAIAGKQLETTLTALGTVYSQLLLIGSKDIDSGRTQRLRESIADQVAALQALQDTLDEIYDTSAIG